MMKWYIATVSFTPQIEDILVRIELKQETYNAFTRRDSEAAAQVLSLLRSKAELKRRSFGELDVLLEEDENQRPL